MLEDKQIKKIRELREKEITVKDIAKAVGVSESSVKKYISDDYEKDNEIDEKTGKALTDLMIEELDFEDGVIPLVYKLKNQANEIDVNLFDYLTDISDTMSKFLRITNKPEWFYYVFCELANSLSVFTDHIEAKDLMEAIDNFYKREIDMENAEAFITDIETKTEKLLENSKEEYADWQEKINETQKEHARLTSLNTVILSKMIQAPDRENLEKTEEKLKILQAHAQNLENNNKQLKMGNQLILKKLELTDKENQELKQQLSAFNIVFDKISKLFPEQINDIIQEIDNESQ